MCPMNGQPCPSGPTESCIYRWPCHRAAARVSPDPAWVPTRQQLDRHSLQAWTVVIASREQNGPQSADEVVGLPTHRPALKSGAIGLLGLAAVLVLLAAGVVIVSTL